MKQQADLLTAYNWNVLIVLDACRADAYQEITGRSITAHSLGWSTRHWIGHFKSLMSGETVLIMSGNPVVSRDFKHSRFKIAHLWDLWGRYGPCNMPTIHPKTVTNATLNYLKKFGQPSRMIVWYVQPHAPYIGEVAIPYGSPCGDSQSAVAQAMREHMTVEVALGEGKVSMEKVRECYYSNLRFVLPFAQGLLKELKGRIVITADHGDALGEDGKYGHGRRYPINYEVPWDTYNNGAFTPSPIGIKKTKPPPMTAILGALGYL